LADEKNKTAVVDGQNPDGPIGEVHDAVSAGRAVRLDDFVVPHRQPWVLVGDPASQALPGVTHHGWNGAVVNRIWSDVRSSASGPGHRAAEEEAEELNEAIRDEIESACVRGHPAP
jgi:hypothetical protein